MTNQPTPPATTLQVHLRTSILREGVGSSEAVLLYEALKDYSETLIKHIAWAHKNEDDESATDFWHDFQEVANLQRRLYNELAQVAFQNQQVRAERPTDQETYLAEAVAEYRKFFQVKP